MARGGQPIDQDDVSGDGDDDDDEEFSPEGSRDFVMARLAAAQSAARGAVDAIQEAIDSFADPGADPKGMVRVKSMEAADNLLGESAAGLHLAMAELKEAGKDFDFDLGEPESEPEEPPPSRSHHTARRGARR